MNILAMKARLVAQYVKTIILHQNLTNNKKQLYIDVYNIEGNTHKF